MKKLSLLLVAGSALSLQSCGFEIVDTGSRGVETRFGEVVGDAALTEGMHFYNPFTSEIIEISVRTETWNGNTTAYTKDVQQAKVTFSVNYNLSPSHVIPVYKEIGRDWSSKLVAQVVPAVIKNVFGRWDAVELVANRSKATKEIEQELIDGLKERGVTVSRFEVTNIDYADEFEKAVEAKVVAIQKAAEAENKTKQIEEEAKQQVISAKAEAESMRIRANALSQNKALVEYEAVQRWNGELPQYMLGNSVPFIDVKK